MKFSPTSSYRQLHSSTHPIFTFLQIALLFIVIATPSTAFASSYSFLNTPPTQQNVARAGVSVVRLVASYTTQTGQAGQQPIVVQCTGLGMLVASWPTQQGSDQNNWILTDGSLVNGSLTKNAGPVTCDNTNPSGTLSSLQVFLSTSYNPNIVFIPFASVPQNEIICQNATDCSKGAALFSFNDTALFPYSDLPAATANAPQSSGIGLTQSNALETPPPVNGNKLHDPQYDQEVESYLTPHLMASTVSSLEPGTPLVDASGSLVGLHLSAGSTLAAADISSFMQVQPALQHIPQNLVHDNWNKGITAFYQQHNYAQACSAFQQIVAMNAQFQGANDFAQFAFAQFAQQNAARAAAGNTSLGGFKFQNLFLPYWIVVSIASLILLALLLLLITLRFARSYQKRRRFQKEVDEANRQATLETQRIKEMEILQREAWAQQPMLLPSATPTVESAPPSIEPIPPTPYQSPSQHCPHCKASFPLEANSCPNCSLPLPQKAAQIESRQPLTQSINIASPVRPETSSDPPQVKQSTLSASWESVQNKLPDLSQSHNSRQSQDNKSENNHVEFVPNTPGRTGQRLGNYRLISLLGHGGFADVYLGEHIFLRTQAAVKVLQIHLTPDVIKKFLEEARTIAELTHPHIVRILDFGMEGKELDLDQSMLDVAGSTPFLIMDYAPHGTLRNRHPKGSRLPLTTIVPYVQQIASALQYAHEKKRIHRDVKPENMLIGPNNDILLSDFGIAVVAHSEQSMSTHEMAGTLAYIAPEQIRGKPRPASDQYALGIVVYEWLSGVRPFLGTTTWEIMNQHLSVEPPGLKEKLPSISPAVEEVVMKAISKDPGQRFESVQAFADTLTKVASQ